MDGTKLDKIDWGLWEKSEISQRILISKTAGNVIIGHKANRKKVLVQEGSRKKKLKNNVKYSIFRLMHNVIFHMKCTQSKT